MKTIISTIIILATAATTLSAQDGVIGIRNIKDQGEKLLTMEEAVIGANLAPENKNYKWRGDLSEISMLEGDILMIQGVSGKCTVEDPVQMISLDKINKDLGTSMKRFPSYQWTDSRTIEFMDGWMLYRYDVVDMKKVLSIKLPEDAGTFTPASTSPEASPLTDEPTAMPRIVAAPVQFHTPLADAASATQSTAKLEAATDPTQYFAFTRNNNLYILDQSGNETAVTSDDDPNIVNGQSVSRNEFGINGGIFWSPDASLLAFYRKDESAVGTFPLLDITTRTGTLREIKYPMAGMASEHISLGVYNLFTRKTVFLKVTDFDEERYLTNISWTPDSKHILIQVLDRSQKNMHLNMYCAADGSFEKTLFEEHNDRFVEPTDPLIFLEPAATKYAAALFKKVSAKNNAAAFVAQQYFLYRTDNRDGYKNLYMCDLNGNIMRLTSTDADVAYVGQRGTRVFYTSAEVSPIENHLFSIDLKNRKVTRHTMAEGWHTCAVSGDGQYFIDNYSSLCVPRVIALESTKSTDATILLAAADPVHDYNYGEIVLGTVKSADGLYDNYYRLIKPADFDSAKKYPVIVYVYGGPHSQMVQNTFLGLLRRWEMLMAQKGYVVYVQDNRGTSNRGAAFEKAIYGECGQAEMADQMEGIKMITSLPYVDASRIGIHGWSYGGFMTISLKTNYPEIFKVAVAGGPVIDWKWYEVMYGERYMGSPLTNAAGYEKVSLIPRAKDLKGKLLICQGGIDNTVVWEHSLSFINECIHNLIQVDYFPYPCHEHNVRGRERIHLMDKVTMYFEDYL